MSLFDELSEFIGESHVAREITFKNKTRTFHFRELNAGEAEDFFAAVDKDPKKNKGLRNRLLAKVVCDEKGGDALTEKEAAKLPNDLANKLQDAALEVNGMNQKGQDDAKKE
jgi:hypothetical protein